MNRKLLLLGVILSVVTVVASTAILFLKGASSDATENLAFTIAVQINFFHALILFVLASMKRKYNDENLISIGWIFTLSTLVFSGTAYFSMLSDFGIYLFNTIGIVGAVGLFIGWIALSRAFYSIFVPKKH
jgi:uncharacterized membrane protein YgdD (TMEM256/DUF423 family)